jgi:outer membrane autotransporter protein
VTGFSFPAGGPALAVGDKVVLIRATTAIAGSVAANNVVNASQGSLLHYEMATSVNTTDLELTVRGKILDQKAKSLSEGYFGSAGFLVNTFDFVSLAGVETAVAQARNARSFSSEYRFTGFATAYAGKVRYMTGSHVDVKSFAGMIGISGLIEGGSYDLVLGAFFESGSGSYDSHITFPNAADVFGDGDVSYGGAGVLARIDFAKGERGNFHVEAAGRIGSVKNKYKGWKGISDAVSYDSKASYYGAHLGFGHLFDFSGRYQLDLFAKYFWTRQNGDTLRLAGGEWVDFEKVNSHRLRGGVRFAFIGGEKFKPYIGAAYEHEFDAKVKARSYGFTLPEPDASGGSFAGELGFLLTPSDRVTINVGAQGYAGKRRGISGTAALHFSF